MSNTRRSNRNCIFASVAGVLFVVVVVIAVAVPLSKRSTDDDFLAAANKILEKYPVIDGHNDWPYQMRKDFKNNISHLNLNSDLSGLGWHTDIPRLKKGHVGGQFWACFVFCSTQYKDSLRQALEQIDVIKRFTADYSEDFEFVTTAEGLEKAMADGKIGSLIGVEGGHMIDSSLAVLRMLYDLGTRYMTLTHSCHTPWADTASDVAAYDGLTDFGRKVVKEMNRMGMMVDISHVSNATMGDVLDVSTAPVIFSHSSVYDICKHERNVPDEILDRLRVNNGIIMINFYNNYISCNESANITHVADHFDYVKNRIGTLNLGIGGDYDGVTNVPDNLSDVSMYPNLIAELLKRGWTETEIKDVTQHNLIRVFKQVEKVAKESTGYPDETWISEEDFPLNTNSCRSNN